MATSSTGAYTGLGAYRYVAGDVTTTETLRVNELVFGVLAEFRTMSNVGYAGSWARPGYYNELSGVDHWAPKNTFSINHPGSDWATAGSQTEWYAFPRLTYDYRVQTKGWFKMAGVWEDMCFEWHLIPKLWVPWAPTGAQNTRNSDYQNTVSWVNGSGGEGEPQRIIERSTDGGGWTQVAERIINGATSWIDTTTAPDHSYKYRIRTEWFGQYSAWSESNVTYNTPGAPGKPVLARTADNKVSATLTNTSKTATALEWQYSTDKTSWSASTAVSGSSVTAFIANPGGGTYYYFRCRNTRGSLVSAWSAVSDAVATMLPPAAPNLLEPQSGATIATTQQKITFKWRHNTLDGSAQVAARLRYSTNGGSSWVDTWQINTSTQQTQADISQFVPPATSGVTWQVCTKGSDAAYSPWSTSERFYVKSPPQLSVVAPSGTITTMPFAIAWDYSDTFGTQANAIVEIRDAQDKLVFERALTGQEASTQITSAHFIPVNNATFGVTVRASSTSGLFAVAEGSFQTAYTPPPLPSGQVEVDSESLSTTIMAIAGEGAPQTASLSVFRKRADGTLLEIAGGVASYSLVRDPYPPLDSELTYIIAAYTEAGVSTSIELKEIVKSRGTTVFNFGDDYQNLAKLMLNPDWSRSLAHDSTIFETAGAREPLIFYGIPQTRSGSVSGTVPRTQELLFGDVSPFYVFDALAEHTGYVIMREPHTDKAKAVALEVGFKRMSAEYVDVNISWREVRSHGLVI
jgi:hypothetical protein